MSSGVFSCRICMLVAMDLQEPGTKSAKRWFAGRFSCPTFGDHRCRESHLLFSPIHFALSSKIFFLKSQSLEIRTEKVWVIWTGKSILKVQVILDVQGCMLETSEEGPIMSERHRQPIDRPGSLVLALSIKRVSHCWKIVKSEFEIFINSSLLWQSDWNRFDRFWNAGGLAIESLH